MAYAGTNHGICLKGSPQMHLDSITIRDVTISSATSAVEISYMDHLVMEKVVINGEEYTVDGGHAKQAHVHPSFSPKGNYICYTSDRTGVPQVYVVPVGDITNAEQ